LLQKLGSVYVTNLTTTPLRKRLCIGAYTAGPGRLRAQATV